MIGFLIYKVYNEVFYGKDSTPFYRVYLYISLLFIELSFVLYLLISGLLKYLIKYNFFKISLISPNYIFFIFIFGVLPLTYTYFRFFTKKALIFIMKSILIIGLIDFILKVLFSCFIFFYS